MTEFYSNGKLLLTGEYAVLDGATGLAIPTKYGQSLAITNLNEPKINWKSFDEKGKAWFQCDIDLSLIQSSNAISFTTDIKIAETLLSILIEANKLSSNFLNTTTGYKIETKLNFPREWGLGTSSTLINNIAQWAKVNAFELLNKTMGGSGYDIACAQNNFPILYTQNSINPIVEKVEFNPVFSDQLYFVFLNKKQNSRKAIEHYRKATFDKTTLVTQLNTLTLKMANCTDLHQFKTLISKHEELLSNILQIETVKSSLFSDYKGAIKSLGAWGGDFILATGDKKSLSYFKKRGYKTIVPFNEMVLK